MKTTIHLFNNLKDINTRSLQLPERVTISLESYDMICSLVNLYEPVKLDNSQLYHNQWLHEQGFFIPDLATMEKAKFGFYLEQTHAMIEARETTLECSFCHSQYKQAQTPFCIDCLHHYNLEEDQLHLLYLRPVATMNITLTHRSILIPPWLRAMYNNIRSPVATIGK